MLARGKVKWFIVGSRQDSERSQEEEEEEQGEMLKGRAEDLGVSLRLITIECDCDSLSDVTRLIKVASHIDPNRSDFPERWKIIKYSRK